jgi:hypothetical protein
MNVFESQDYDHKKETGISPLYKILEKEKKEKQSEDDIFSEIEIKFSKLSNPVAKIFFLTEILKETNDFDLLQKIKTLFDKNILHFLGDNFEEERDSFEREFLESFKRILEQSISGVGEINELIILKNKLLDNSKLFNQKEFNKLLERIELKKTEFEV